MMNRPTRSRSYSSSTATTSSSSGSSNASYGTGSRRANTTKPIYHGDEYGHDEVYNGRKEPFLNMQSNSNSYLNNGTQSNDRMDSYRTPTVQSTDTAIGRPNTNTHPRIQLPMSLALPYSENTPSVGANPYINLVQRTIQQAQGVTATASDRPRSVGSYTDEERLHRQIETYDNHKVQNFENQRRPLSHRGELSDIARRRIAVNQNLEELISLVIKENESYRTEVYRLRDEVLELHNLLRQREHELTIKAEEQNLISESEMARVIVEHTDTLRVCKQYQKQLKEEQEYSAKLEAHLQDCTQESMQFAQHVSTLNNEMRTIKDKLEEVSRSNRLLELAYDEVLQYRRERIVREIAYPSNYEEEVAKLRSELYVTNEKCKHLENEIAYLQAEKQSQTKTLEAKTDEVKRIESEKQRVIEKATNDIMAAEKAKAEAEALAKTKAAEGEAKAKALEDAKKEVEKAKLALKQPEKQPEVVAHKHPIALKAEKRASISLQEADLKTSRSNSPKSIGTITPKRASIVHPPNKPASEQPLTPSSAILQQLAAVAGKELSIASKGEVDLLDLSMNDFASLF